MTVSSLLVRNPVYQEATGESVERFIEPSASLEYTDACQTPDFMPVKV